MVDDDVNKSPEADAPSPPAKLTKKAAKQVEAKGAGENSVVTPLPHEASANCEPPAVAVGQADQASHLSEKAKDVEVSKNIKLVDKPAEPAGLKSEAEAVTDESEKIVAAEPLPPFDHTDEDGFPLPRRQHLGMHYLDVIGKIDTILKPSTYLEIGTHDGSSLKRISCPSVAIDPKFVIDSDVIGTKSQFFAFQMTSDRFFEQNDPKALLGGPIKLAFLDGMHRFEFLLRDFIQVEKHCEPNSLIMLHDCFPLNVSMTERVYDGISRPGFNLVKNKQDLKRPAFWWTGDVWKVLWILKKYRPELVAIHLDAAPTGLALLTGLNPRSTVLEDRYFSIIHEFGAIAMDENKLNEHYANFKLYSAYNVATESQLSRCFWF